MPESPLSKEIFTLLVIENRALLTFQIDCGASVNIVRNALSAILNCHRHPNAWLCETKQKSRSAAYHNSKSQKSDWKKRSGEFEVVAVNLTSLTVARAAQHMKIIKVNGKNFVRNNRIRQGEVELKKAVSVY